MTVYPINNGDGKCGGGTEAQDTQPRRSGTVPESGAVARNVPECGAVARMDPTIRATAPYLGTPGGTSPKTKLWRKMSPDVGLWHEKPPRSVPQPHFWERQARRAARQREGPPGLRPTAPGVGRSVRELALPAYSSAGVTPYQAIPSASQPSPTRASFSARSGV